MKSHKGNFSQFTLLLAVLQLSWQLTWPEKWNLKSDGRSPSCHEKVKINSVYVNLNFQMNKPPPYRSLQRQRQSVDWGSRCQSAMWTRICYSDQRCAWARLVNRGTSMQNFQQFLSLISSWSGLSRKQRLSFHCMWRSPAQGRLCELQRLKLRSSA